MFPEIFVSSTWVCPAEGHCQRILRNNGRLETFFTVMTADEVCTDIYWVEAMYATKHPAMQRTAPAAKNYLAPNVRSAKVENEYYQIMHLNYCCASESLAMFQKHACVGITWVLVFKILPSWFSGAANIENLCSRRRVPQSFQARVLKRSRWTTENLWFQTPLLVLTCVRMPIYAYTHMHD